ncbi:MAG: glycosyltransferase [Bacteroidota bacterium]|jgi:glycosyltransferase involved in cell wall biosynthesis
MHTVLTDVLGLTIYVTRFFFPKKKLQPLSICTGIYNRSSNYLNRLLNSLEHAEYKHLIELSVFDCCSDDISDLEAEIRKRWKGKLVFTREPVKFARSYTFNKAVDQASHELIFICDADLSLPKNIVNLCNQYTGKNTVWYPIYFFLYKDKPAILNRENGEWEQYGSRGMLACTKNAFYDAGRLNEAYTVWGGEDTDLWERFHRRHYIIIRNRVKGLFHHWHQTFNKKFEHMND